MSENPKKSTGSGTTAEISTDGGTTYKKFASVTKLSPPNMSRATVEVTDMNSFETNDQMKEFLTDFIEADEMSVEGYVLTTDDGRDAAETAFYSGAEVKIKIVLPKAIGKTMTVTGLITAYQPIGDISTSDGLAFSMSIKPTKKPELSPTV